MNLHNRQIEGRPAEPVGSAAGDDNLGPRADRPAGGGDAVPHVGQFHLDIVVSLLPNQLKRLVISVRHRRDQENRLHPASPFPGAFRAFVCF